MNAVRHRFLNQLLMMVVAAGFLFSSSLVAAPQMKGGGPKPTGDEQKLDWSPAISNLKTRLDIDEDQSFVAGEEFEVEIMLHSPQPQDATNPKLLAGHFVILMVPTREYFGRATSVTTTPFSGGGIDVYAGDKGLKYKVRAPALTGQYEIFACVHSSTNDVLYFRMTAKMGGSNDIWWTGVLASPSHTLIVTEPEAGEIRADFNELDHEPEVTVYRFVGKPKTNTVRVDDDSQVGWHNELRISVEGIDVPFGNSTGRGEVAAPVHLDPGTEYTYFLERTEYFLHTEFALQSIEKEGVVVYRQTH